MQVVTHKFWPFSTRPYTTRSKPIVSPALTMTTIH